MRAPFAKLSRTVGYGYDTLLDVREDGTSRRLVSAAERVLSVNVSVAGLNTTSSFKADSFTGVPSEQLDAFVQAAGITSGTLSTTPGRARLHKYETVDAAAAEREAILSALLALTESNVTTDRATELLSMGGSPAGNHLAGVNIVSPQGATPLALPRMMAVTAENKGSTHSPVVATTAEFQQLTQAGSLAELAEAGHAILTRLAEDNALIADFLELADDIGDNLSMFPSPRSGVMFLHPKDAGHQRQLNQLRTRIQIVLPGLYLGTTSTRASAPWA